MGGREGEGLEVYLRDTKEDAQQFLLFLQLREDQGSSCLLAAVRLEGVKHRPRRLLEQTPQVDAGVLLQQERADPQERREEA